MKKFLLIIAFCASIANGTDALKTKEQILPDSTTIANTSLSADTVNISELVLAQFENAKNSTVKSAFNYQVPEQIKEVPVKVKKVEKTDFESFVVMLNDINAKYTNVVILVLATILILGFIFGRRVIKRLLMSSKKDMIRRINLIREEHPIFKTNKKLRVVRTGLSDSSNIMVADENLLNAHAKNMQVGKGEVLLAAKIKAFQLSNISR